MSTPEVSQCSALCWTLRGETLGGGIFSGCGSYTARVSTTTSEVAGVGFCFLCRNAALRLAFLLSVDGLDLFLVLPLLTRAGPLPLVSREKEKVEPTEREKLKAKPWPANTWQRSRHLAAKEESLSPTAVILVCI